MRPRRDRHDEHVHGPEPEEPLEHEHGPPPPLPPLAPGDPGPKALTRIEAPSVATFVSDRRRAAVELKSARNPDPNGSFGYVGRFVRVGGNGELSPGSLVIKLDGRRLGDVVLDTLQVFRWDPDTGSFDLVPQSGLGQTGDYVWARITEPGLYGVVGLPTDPLIVRTLAILASLEGLVGLDGGDAFLPKICGLILCAPDVHARMQDPEFVRGLVEDNMRLGLPGRWPPGPAPGGGYQGICEKCLGGGLQPRLPGEKLGKAVKFPELRIWPKFCVVSPREIGRWDVLPVVPAPADVVLAVHAALLPTGKVLYFGGAENIPSQHPQPPGVPQFDNTRVFDPATGTIDVVPSPPGHDLFCCGQALLGDGKVLVAGGTFAWGGVGGLGIHGGHWFGERKSAVFDPAFAPGANPWTVTGPLNSERGTNVGGGGWYPTLLTLADGRVLRMLGHPERTSPAHHINDMLETFDPATQTWTDEGAAADAPVDISNEYPYYPRLHVLPDGQVFCSTPLPGPPPGESWRWNPATKAWSAVGSGPGPEYGGYGTSSVLLPLMPPAYPPRVLAASREQPKIIDLGAANPAWTNTNARVLTGTPPRENATAVLLPDATVLVVGGHRDVPPGSPAGTLPVPVLAAERYDPFTGTWSTLASAAVPRVYHSVALLLPDGRVWTAGSDYGPTPGIHEARMEVYSPPYLFWGPRPTIAAAPATLPIPGTATFNVSTPEAPSIRSAALIRCGTATHAFNGDQRYVGLEITGNTNTRVTLAAPPNKNIAPPGYYMLFLVDRVGVPSVGRFIRVT